MRGEAEGLFASHLAAAPADLTLILTGRAPMDARPVALESLLTRGERRTLPTDDLPTLLWALAGREASDPVPVAAVMRLGLTREADAGHWLIGDPVTLLPARDRVLLADPAPAPEPSEADRLIAAFNETFGEDGWRLERHDGNWLLRTPLTAPVQTTATQRAAGQDIHPLLPRGSERIAWHRFLAEVQMLFHMHPVNAEREARGLAPINSLWPWGGGMLPARGTPMAVTWAGRAPFLLGLANLGGATTADGEFDALAGRLPAVALVDAPLDAVETDWARPLLGALKAGRLGRARLIVPAAGFMVDVSRRHLGRWWRRRRPLGELLGLPHVGP